MVMQVTAKRGRGTLNVCPQISFLTETIVYVIFSKKKRRKTKFIESQKLRKFTSKRNNFTILT